MTDSAITTEILNEPVLNKKRIRIAVALIYFSMGLCFSSWASRIPDIKTALNLSDAAFGSILFALPVGQFLMMPFSGKLVTRFSSQRVVLFAIPAYSLFLVAIGMAQAGWQLAVVLFFFGVTGNLCNISINTLGIAAERLYGRPIMASFHGGWSLAGFTGALIGMVLIHFNFVPVYHFMVVVAAVWAIVWINLPHLSVCKTTGDHITKRKRFFGKPDPVLLQLGIIGFCSMASEGAMFDWSGIYFKDVIKAPASLVVLGYTSFMIMMASGRFVADFLIVKIGRKKLLQISGVLISGGLFTAVIFPQLLAGTLAFMLVGIGVSSIVPTVYSTAGKQTHIPPGIALATVSSVSFLGFLMGPPLIGYIAEAFSLRYSFAVIGIFGLGITLMVSRVKAFQNSETKFH